MRHGFLLIDKPIGETSHTTVAAVRKRLSERDIGHIGTLDPSASGLLVMAVGSKALKVIELFNDLPKSYRAEITFGAVSTTYDREGVIEQVAAKSGWQIPDEEQIRRLVIDRFTGPVSQVPPIFSAVHVNGQRAHNLARRGIPVTLQPRIVQIEKCEIINYDYPNLTLDVHCGSGTYIRSLAHDLGHELRCGGYLSGLRRTAVGPWSVDHAVQPHNATWTDIIPLKDILSDFSRIDLTEREWRDIQHGRTIAQIISTQTFGWYEDLPVALLIPADRGCRPRKVL